MKNITYYLKKELLNKSPKVKIYSLKNKPKLKLKKIENDKAYFNTKGKIYYIDINEIHSSVTDDWYTLSQLKSK